eukprot:CAMPEP_0196578774 /NCGR_PEP_ID=MMETSP1081-20130531/7613_1 /TAXON_ID=36882 /ORGANISM="Pyramimonas amylifera, Strain CCMP720" /LENGTH=173 /DNA_ID=CAMNT_0041898091 /DNA_START=778 /DNA_END=1299 /DNA_ORIENTATION=+
MNEMNGVIQLCDSLYSIHSGNYYKRLTSLPKHDALRFETTRFLISGDPLRMAANTIQFSKIKDQSRIYTNFLENSTGADEDIRKSISRILKFSFQDRQDITWVLKVADTYLDKYHDAWKKESHVTSSTHSKSERMDMMLQLEKDKVLGPILRKLRVLIKSYTDIKSNTNKMKI